tara:strand:+ start:844 stop:1212 length:369 start_codon:yes stop_codon:yes gene_type:complete
MNNIHITMMAIVIVLFGNSIANAHTIKESNYYQCGSNEVIITSNKVKIRGWDFQIVSEAKFKQDFKRKGQAVIRGHLIIASFNVGSTLNNPDYYVINRQTLTYTRTRGNGKTYNGSCLDFKG